MGVKEKTDMDEVMAKGREAFYQMRQAAAEAGLQDMSLDEINEEIRLVRDSNQRKILGTTHSSDNIGQ